MSPNWMNLRMEQALQNRREKGTLRRLNANNLDDDQLRDAGKMDFSSNDYLGLAHSPEQRALVAQMYQQVVQNEEERQSGSGTLLTTTGATGSRLLSGDSKHFHQLEAYLATVHRRPAALLCNSGYDANLCVVSSLTCHIILYDAYIHNSLHMGLRLWQSSSSSSDTRETESFPHNSVRHLELLLKKYHGQRRRVVVLVESVYSMDGDVAPLNAMLAVAHEYNALVVVDEAHALGVYGKRARNPMDNANSGNEIPGGTGVLAAYGLEHHPALLCSVHTFGKGAGCHGAVVCGDALLKEYLVNYAYPLIYSTALPLHALVTIRASYETFTSVKGDALRAAVFELVRHFRQRLSSMLKEGTDSSHVHLLPSTSPIQALMIAGNEPCTEFCQRLFRRSQGRVRLFPIKSPTVPVGQERVRIILHSHNSTAEVDFLCTIIQSTLQEMGLLQKRFHRSSKL